ncbi:MAG: transcription termination/antitermination protein NusA [Bacteroidaceae bacterium]|nr:transcription termination/antitermination protein NusA [Bacteroidaceae bacterium]
MAKKAETISMVDTFSEFKNLKNIEETTMISVLEESFRNVLAKMFGTDENFDVIVNPKKGDFEIWRNREIVEDGAVTNPNMQISLSEAKAIDPDFEVGEDVTDEVFFEKFGRRAILNLRQTLASKILDLQKDSLYNTYKDRIGELISAEVYQIWKKEMLLVDDENNEIQLPKEEQIPTDFYRKGDTVRAIVLDVENKNNNPKIIVSRTSNDFLRRLFELEVPEIHDGLILIRAIARIPGERAKIAVESYDDRIDPVGACVGVKGSRIHGIVRELRNENIDVINYTSNPSLFIQRALSPAKIASIEVDEENKRASVYLNDSKEVSLAIGKNGLNIRLAMKLTGYDIEVCRMKQEGEEAVGITLDKYDGEISTEAINAFMAAGYTTDLSINNTATDELAAKTGLDHSIIEQVKAFFSNEEDVFLDEFANEIDQWVIDALKKIGCKTAKGVLARSREELIDKADLEEDTVDEVLEILRAEFED